MTEIVTIRSMKSAYDNGYAAASSRTAKYTVLENLIFDMMAANPYKSEKARKQFIAGVSACVNEVGCYRNRRMNGPKAN